MRNIITLLDELFVRSSPVSSSSGSATICCKMRVTRSNICIHRRIVGIRVEETRSWLRIAVVRINSIIILHVISCHHLVIDVLLHVRICICCVRRRSSIHHWVARCVECIIVSVVRIIVTLVCVRFHHFLIAQVNWISTRKVKLVGIPTLWELKIRFV